jgi:four helix bundle protein
MVSKKWFTLSATIFLRPFNEEIEMLKNFRSYELAVTVYRFAITLKLPCYLKDQLVRAASSVVLNIAEGAGRTTSKEQARFFDIAYASAREVQAVLDLHEDAPEALIQAADCLGAHLYRLRAACRRR